jgi:hypothetical protein
MAIVAAASAHKRPPENDETDARILHICDDVQGNGHHPPTFFKATWPWQMHAGGVRAPSGDLVPPPLALTPRLLFL